LLIVAGYYGDSGGVECYLWSGVIYGDMYCCRGDVLRTSVSLADYGRHHAGYDSHGMLN